MTDTLHDPQIVAQELRQHEQTFHSFSKLVLFAILHIIVVLSCLALAFLGNAPLMAIVLGVGGTVVLLAAFAITA
jgi:Bacterial aa3 type cytochrome c oxidase subunit IV